MVGSSFLGSGTVGSAVLDSGAGVSVSSGSGDASSAVSSRLWVTSSADSCWSLPPGASAVGAVAAGAGSGLSAIGAVSATDGSSELSAIGSSPGSVGSSWV